MLSQVHIRQALWPLKAMKREARPANCLLVIGFACIRVCYSAESSPKEWTYAGERRRFAPTPRASLRVHLFLFPSRRQALTQGERLCLDFGVIAARLSIS